MAPAESPRYSISALAGLGVGAAAEVLGRATVIDDTGFELRDEETSVRVLTDAPPPRGAWVRVHGQWRGEFLAATQVVVESQPATSFPHPDGDWAWFHDDGGRRMEFLRARGRMLHTVHDFFERRSVLEVHTPSVVPSPGLEPNLEALGVSGMGEQKWLITSPEYQMKRLLSAGLPRIYQISRCFRREELGEIHEPEFTMIEWYRTFAGSADVMTDTEELVAHVARSAHRGTHIPARGAPVEVAPPWDRLTVAEAYRLHAGVELGDILPDEELFYRLMVEKVQPKLGLERPVFLTHWPASMASLARLHPDNPSLADRFEGFIAGVEICNGFGELVDPREQRRRLEADIAERRRQGSEIYPIDERFLSALEEGIPPSGGNALGFDRLVMLVLGAPTLADVMPIPWSRL